MFKELLFRLKAQGQMIAAGIGMTIIAVIVALGMTLVNNFEAETGSTVPFDALWPLAVMGMAIVGLIISAIGVVRR